VLHVAVVLVHGNEPARISQRRDGGDSLEGRSDHGELEGKLRPVLEPDLAGSHLRDGLVHEWLDVPLDRALQTAVSQQEATQPSGKRASIDEAAREYAASETPLIVFAGTEYGSGSSRDWAAKGTALLGVRVVVVRSFELPYVFRKYLQGT
jgi:hypothetical protein